MKWLSVRGDKLARYICFFIGLLFVIPGMFARGGQIITVDALGAVRITYPSSINFEIGSVVAGIGDFNGDGFQDAAIGAPSFEPADIGNDYDTGAVFIISGIQLNRERGELDLSSESFEGVTVMGRFESRIGQAIDGAGDVNGDGFKDVVIGSGNHEAGYIIYGSERPRRLFPLNDLQQGGVEITHTGYSVTGVGDFNGDGFSDTVFGNPEAEKKSIKQNEQEKEYDACRLTIVYGAADLPPVLDSRIRSDRLLSLRGILGMRLGEFVCGNFDINSDGYSDVLAVAPKGGKDLKGRAYLFFGPSIVNESDEAVYKFAIDHVNHFVRRAGDVNGDGFPELLIGRDGQSTFLLWGGDQLHGTLDLNNLDARLGVLLQGAPSTYDAGDINGDGLADLAVGLPHDSVRDKAHAGRSVFLFGNDKWPKSVDVSKLCAGALSSIEYVVVEGTEAFGAFGTSIASLGDIQNDGCDDVIVGSPFQTLPGDLRLESPGSAFVIQGLSLYQSLESRRSIFLSSEKKKD